MNQIINFILLGFIGPQEIIILLIIPALSVIPLIFYLLTLQNTFNAISIENRRMQSGEVWLTLIPLFGLVWQFIIVNRLADSLKAEFNAKNITVDEERPGVGIGLAYCILFCCSIIPFVNFLTGVAGIICWIIYWSKINNYKIKLIQS
ncbi:hypothetical protein SAMN05444285_102226 [Draconibacterium orientale]|uniref:DUF4234 domain-containing protein n=1 Tax=Draconibacterium orientale TaxID=1168034 RepID=X5DMJ5_9BACT|nr:hypothetical protein [Draconibacterium orientale]AHW61787.1 hypothetical protein FH5T_08300 [Draconibacterium orientale]SES83657.1 hypothetical protein SAMN05444285_102226 [Draconibacterium orientale]